jgi:hypothetical protein
MASGLPTVASPYASSIEPSFTLGGVFQSFGETSTAFHHWADEFVVYAPACWSVGQLNEALHATGQHLGLKYPEHWLLAQVVAYAPTPRHAGWGRTLRQSLLGLHWLDASCTGIGAGGRVLKNVTGYDLHRLHLGFQGTLGFPLGVCLRTMPLSPLPQRTFLHKGSYDDFNARFQQLRHTPPDAIQAMYRNNHGGYCVWQGSDALATVCLPETSFVEISEDHEGTSGLDDATLLLTLRGVEVERFEAHWNRACACFPMLELHWNLALGEVQLAQPNTLKTLDATTLDALQKWLHSVRQAFPLLVLHWWNAPSLLEVQGANDWMKHLSPLLWKQWQAIRNAWGIESHEFPSPYFSEQHLIKQGVLPQRMKEPCLG